MSSRPPSPRRSGRPRTAEARSCRLATLGQGHLSPAAPRRSEPSKRRRRSKPTTVRTTTFHFEEVRRRAGDKPARQRATRKTTRRFSGGSKCLSATVLPALRPECHAGCAPSGKRAAGRGRRDGQALEFPRRPQDAYPTPAEAVAPLLPHLAPRTRFIEPCAGEGCLIKHLQSAGHVSVGAYDLPDDARTKRYAVDDADVFLTNPPWRREVLHPIIENLEQSVADVAAPGRGVGSHEAVDSVPAAPPHHRQRRPREVDQGFAVHRQGRLRLVSVRPPAA